MQELGLSNELKNNLLRFVTSHSRQLPSQEEMIAALNKALESSKSKSSSKLSQKIENLKTAKDFWKHTGSALDLFDTFISHEDIAQGKSGIFDARSLGCWLEISQQADVPFVPAQKILTIHEALIELITSPDCINTKPERKTLIHKVLNKISGNALSRLEGPLPNMSQREKRALHAQALKVLEEAGQAIPAGHMVRHDNMGSATLKTWSAVGWEPWDGDDGVTFREGDHSITLGPGWLQLGNRRFLDVTDARTVNAVATNSTSLQTFWSRPWEKAARRFPGKDIHRSGLPEEMQNGSWPAEWRVFIRRGKAIACASYYAWADIPDTEENREAANEAMRLGQKIANKATELQTIPVDLHLHNVHNVSAEAQREIPADQINACLDFIETEEGLKLLEGAPAYAPGGLGAHPCAFAGVRWPEGIAFKPAEGIKLTDHKTWPKEALTLPVMK